jgi:glycosyltransferase involved in cell wall biosynthesis
VSFRFSVFTPTHRPDHLRAAYASLVAQTFPDWEWVIVPNGVRANVPESIARDPRVRVIPAPHDVASRGVGALKRYACVRCAGEWLVELDHDDELFPQALARLAEVADRTGPAFVYSDFVHLRTDGSCEIFDPAFGWSSYAVDGPHGERWTAMRAFEPDASSLHVIHYAPNHVRAWHRDVYARAGAHDASMPVADDHALVCCTWLTGAPFVHVPECLYLYRVHADGSNTFVERNAEVQARQLEVSNRYVYALVAEQCRRRGQPMLDLAPAASRLPGFDAIAGVDSVADLRGALPFPDGEVGCVRAWVGFERLLDAWGNADPRFVAAMNEIYRVLAPGGWLLARAPSTPLPEGAPRAPLDTFRAFTRRDLARALPGNACRFQGARIWEERTVDTSAGSAPVFVHADMVALKGQVQPGLVDI